MCRLGEARLLVSVRYGEENLGPGIRNSLIFRRSVRGFSIEVTTYSMACTGGWLVAVWYFNLNG